MKKCLALLLAMMLLVQAIPVTAIAQGGMITSENLTAAVALTGSEDGAPAYHKGMSVDDTMTAKQLIYWLDDVLDIEVHSLENHYEDTENALYSLSKANPSEYTRLTEGSYTALPGLVHSRFRRTIDIRLHLEHWRDSLVEASRTIQTGKAELSENQSDLSEYDIRRISYEIRQAAKQIRSVRAEMVEDADGYLTELQDQLDYMNGVSTVSVQSASGQNTDTLPGDEQYSTILKDWHQEVTNASDPVQMKTTTSSVSSLFPRQQTLLGRLTPISSAEADGTGQVVLTVLNDHQFAINVKDKDGKNVDGAHVKVRDIRSSEDSDGEQKHDPTASGEGDTEDGSAIFETEGWNLKEDKVLFSMEITKDGYQTIIADTVEVKKGSYLTFTMLKHNNQAYIARVSFDGHDCKFSEYEAIANPKNSRESDILVTVCNPSEKTVRVVLEYRDRDGHPYYRTMSDSGDKKEIAPGKQKDLIIKAKWRAQIKAGDSPLTVQKDGKEEMVDSGVLMLLIQESNTNDTDKFKQGPPAWTEDTITVSTQLKTVEAKITQPILNKVLNAPFFKSFDNLGVDVPLLSQEEGDGLFKNINIGLGPLPFSKFIPKIYGATNGAIVLSVGFDIPGNLDKNLTMWQKNDSKEISDTVKTACKALNLNDKNAFLKHIFSGVTTYGQARKKGGLTLGKVSADFFFFFGVQFNWEYDAKTGKWVGVDMSGMAGLTGSLDFSISHTFMPGGFPLVIGANFNASVTVGGALGGTIDLREGEDLTEDSITKAGVDPQFSGGNVNIRLNLTLFAGAGIKGFLSVTLNFYTYFNILFEITGTGIHIKIDFGLGFFLLVELILIKIKLNIYDMEPVTIVERNWLWGDDGKEKSSLPSFSDLFVSRASAEDSSPDDDDESDNMLKAEDYPNLVPETEQILGPVAMSGAGMQVIEIQGEPYAFYIAQGAGSNGKNRITWLRIGTGQTGTFDSVLKDASEKKRRYTLKPGVSLPMGYIDTKYEDVYKDMNAVFYGQDDLSFHVMRMNSNNAEADTVLDATYKELYMLSAMAGSVEYTDDGAIHATENPQIYCLAFRPLEDGTLTCDFPGIQDSELNAGSSSPVYQTNDDITIRFFQSGDLMNFTHLSADELVQSSLSAVSTFMVTGPATGPRWEEQGYYHLMDFEIQNYVIVGDSSQYFSFSPAQFHRTWSGDQANIDFLNNSFSSYIQGDYTSGQGAKRSGRYATGSTVFYSLTDVQEDGRSTLRLSDYHLISMDLAKQENIVGWNVLAGAKRDLVFWVVQDGTQDTGLKFHMHSAVIAHGTSAEDREDIISDLDITINGIDFNIQQIGSTVYVYWPEITGDPNDAGKSVCRLRGVAFDPVTGVASDDFVLAQFAPPADKSIKQILLTEDGYGYYVTDENLVKAGSDTSAAVMGTVCRFPFRLIASLDLEMAVLSQDVIAIGENDTVLLKLVNTGNVAITSFEIAENMIGMDGSVTTVETVHCDTVDPENNYLHMEGESSDDDIKGDHAAWRTRSLMDSVTQSYWQVNRVIRTYDRPDEIHSYSIIDRTDEKEITASEILPGQVAYYTIMLKVPSSWQNKIRLRFDLTKYSATGRVMRSAAMRAGMLSANALTAEPEITYVRNDDGKMQLQESHLLKSGGSSHLYAAEVEPDGTEVLDHSIHNIVVDYRLYTDVNGERRVSIYITDDAVHLTPVKWYGNVYLDLSETPTYFDLPYDEDSTSHAKTHTVDMPVSSLLNGKTASRIKVEVCGVGIDEMTVADNSFYIDLDDDDQLRIVLQPENVTVAPGETAVFYVKAAGGQQPYSYQWQVSDGKGGWKNIDGATTDTLTLENVTSDMNGLRYRCIVTDFNNTSVTSASALLTVFMDVPQTGDTAEPVLWAVCVLIGIAGIVLLIKKKRR